MDGCGTATKTQGFFGWSQKGSLTLCRYDSKLLWAYPGGCWLWLLQEQRKGSLYMPRSPALYWAESWHWNWVLSLAYISVITPHLGKCFPLPYTSSDLFWSVPPPPWLELGSAVEVCGDPPNICSLWTLSWGQTNKASIMFFFFLHSLKKWAC